MSTPSIRSQRASVIIPAYTAADTLGECLASLKAQRLPPGIDLEIIVVDDSSPDATAEVARLAGVRCVQTDKPLSAVEPEWLIWRPAGAVPAGGPGAARNHGVKVSSGDLILFTDADCVPTEGWAASLLAAFSDPQVAGVKGTYLTRQQSLVARFVQLEYSDKNHRMAAREWIDFIDAYSAGYRRDVFLENGGFESALMGDEDQEFSFRLAQKGYKLKLVPTAAVYHRHLTSVRRYLKRKFTIAYWKTQLLRWHPDKALGDSHTPLSQRLQILLLAPALLSLLAGLAWRPALWIAAALGCVFVLTTLPFLAWIARNDWPVLAVAFPMLAGRALAQALGLAVGLLATQWRKPIRTAAISSRDQFVKRAVDVALAGISLIVALPVIAILSLLIRLETPGPVIFRQTRIGQHGRPFQIYKLRTLAAAASPQSGAPAKLPSDPRPTRIGRWLHRWSMDDLPQFWNVLRGKMSLVGPQPEEPAIVAQYTDWHRLRLAVKPGLIGPVPAKGHDSLLLDERVRLELDYIEHYSLVRDFNILLRSIPTMLSGKRAF